MTPVVTLGFTREELDAMEERAWPEAIESWIHDVVTAVLDGYRLVKLAPHVHGVAVRADSTYVITDEKCTQENG